MNLKKLKEGLEQWDKAPFNTQTGIKEIMEAARLVLTSRHVEHEPLTIQIAYHLWAEATSSNWVWTDADEVQDQLRCYRCGLPSFNPFHTNRGEAQDHSYEPGVLVKAP